MKKEIDLLWRKFWALGNAVQEFNMFLRHEEYDYTLTDGMQLFQKTTGLDNELARAAISEDTKTKLKICVCLATEAGILSWYLFHKDSDNVADTEALIKKGKQLIKEENTLGLDRTGHVKDYDVLLNLKRKNTKEYMQPTVRAMMKEIVEAFFSLFLRAEKELKAL